MVDAVVAKARVVSSELANELYERRESIALCYRLQAGIPSYGQVTTNLGESSFSALLPARSLGPVGLIKFVLDKAQTDYTARATAARDWPHHVTPAASLAMTEQLEKRHKYHVEQCKATPTRIEAVVSKKNGTTERVSIERTSQGTVCVSSGRFLEDQGFLPARLLAAVLHVRQTNQGGAGKHWDHFSHEFIDAALSTDCWQARYDGTRVFPGEESARVWQVCCADHLLFSGILCEPNIAQGSIADDAARFTR
jgi:hypothetical protein